MTPKELLFAALRHEKTPRAPWVPFAGVHAGLLIGADATQVLTDEDMLVKSLLEVNRLYRPDGQPVMFDLQLEAEILGCELTWKEGTLPSVSSHPLADTMTVPCRCKLPRPDQGRLPIVLNAMLGISRIFVILSRGAASAERIEKVLALDEREKSEEHPAGDPAFAVEFKDVSFSYGGDKEHLTGISFALNKGASLGIIGPTGCGKSTVVNLLLRLYDVSAGAVYVDGQDVRSLPSEKLRKKFGVVFQNGYLMAASIRENIDYGRNLPEEAIKRAARCAQAEEFIKELPEGYEHDLAQKAGDLSGGQKQRLLIARALAASPEIVVLDDSSSALDYATDAALRKALQREYAGTTRIVVAQRVSSVKNCDLILVLENGSVTGAGTHEELMRTCSEYRAIAETQMGEAV